jgi:hypothetical protein
MDGGMLLATPNSPAELPRETWCGSKLSAAGMAISIANLVPGRRPTAKSSLPSMWQFRPPRLTRRFASVAVASSISGENSSSEAPEMSDSRNPHGGSFLTDPERGRQRRDGSPAAIGFRSLKPKQRSLKSDRQRCWGAGGVNLYAVRFGYRVGFNAQIFFRRFGILDDQTKGEPLKHPTDTAPSHWPSASPTPQSSIYFLSASRCAPANRKNAAKFRVGG